MTKEKYERLTEPFLTSPKKLFALIQLNNWITHLVYILYFILLITLLVDGDDRIVRVIVVPAVSFVAVSIFRNIYNAKRPYEVWGIKPLIPKDTEGKSFPSRHIFSVFVIAMAATYVMWPMAVILIIAGVFLSVTRVIGGAHFTKDVIVGAVIGIVLGYIGFYIL